jgi:hypothetical protein
LVEIKDKTYFRWHNIIASNKHSVKKTAKAEKRMAQAQARTILYPSTIRLNLILIVQ